MTSRERNYVMYTRRFHLWTLTAVSEFHVVLFFFFFTLIGSFPRQLAFFFFPTPTACACRFHLSHQMASWLALHLRYRAAAEEMAAAAAAASDAAAARGRSAAGPAPPFADGDIYYGSGGGSGGGSGDYGGGDHGYCGAVSDVPQPPPWAQRAGDKALAQRARRDRAVRRSAASAAAAMGVGETAAASGGAVSGSNNGRSRRRRRRSRPGGGGAFSAASLARGAGRGDREHVNPRLLEAQRFRATTFVAPSGGLMAGDRQAVPLQPCAHSRAAGGGGGDDDRDASGRTVWGRATARPASAGGGRRFRLSCGGHGVSGGGTLPVEASASQPASSCGGRRTGCGGGAHDDSNNDSKGNNDDDDDDYGDDDYDDDDNDAAVLMVPLPNESLLAHPVLGDEVLAAAARATQAPRLPENRSSAVVAALAAGRPSSAPAFAPACDTAATAPTAAAAAALAAAAATARGAAASGAGSRSNVASAPQIDAVLERPWGGCGRGSGGIVGSADSGGGGGGALSAHDASRSAVRVCEACYDLYARETDLRRERDAWLGACGLLHCSQPEGAKAGAPAAKPARGAAETKGSSSSTAAVVPGQRGRPASSRGVGSGGVGGDGSGSGGGGGGGGGTRGGRFNKWRSHHEVRCIATLKRRGGQSGGGGGAFGGDTEEDGGGGGDGRGGGGGGGGKLTVDGDLGLLLISWTAEFGPRKARSLVRMLRLAGNNGSGCGSSGVGWSGLSGGDGSCVGDGSGGGVTVVRRGCLGAHLRASAARVRALQVKTATPF